MSIKVENFGPTVVYSDQLVKWMRMNTEACGLTKPELVEAFAKAKDGEELPEVLSVAQKADIASVLNEAPEDAKALTTIGRVK